MKECSSEFKTQVHCCGLLFEIDKSSGYFVVTGVVRGSEAAKVQFPLGSIIVKINETNTQGKSESEFRKLLFSSGGDTLLIGATPPGWPSIIDVNLSRASHFFTVDNDTYPEEFDNYCDGWSEKAFDEEHCYIKALHWIENNPPHLAEHRFEHDQVPVSEELTQSMMDNFYGDDSFLFQARKPDADGGRAADGGQGVAWMQVDPAKPVRFSLGRPVPAFLSSCSARGDSARAAGGPPGGPGAAGGAGPASARRDRDRCERAGGA